MMKPKTLNIVCAHPFLVCWFIGATILDAGAVILVAQDLPSPLLLLRPSIALWLALALVPSTCLGFFLGVFTCAPALVFVCRRINGAPFAVGDRVLILAGPRRKEETIVYNITTGQGGQPLLRLDLGPEMKTIYKDIFEEYSVLKIQKGEPRTKG